MSHEAPVMIHCADVRYSRNGIRQTLPEAYDFTYAGAALGLISDPMWSTSLFAQWQKLIATKKIIVNKIIIVDHYSAKDESGCIAYEHDDSFERHKRNLHAAAKVIKDQKSLQNIPIELYLHDIDAGILEAIPFPLT